MLGSIQRSALCEGDEGPAASSSASMRAAQWLAAKRAKDWETADRLRRRLRRAGVDLDPAGELPRVEIQRTDFRLCLERRGRPVGGRLHAHQLRAADQTDGRENRAGVHRAGHVIGVTTCGTWHHEDRIISQYRGRNEERWKWPLPG